MINVHRDYLLKQLREERDSAWKAFAAETEFSASKPDTVRAITRLHNQMISSFKEIEFQIDRAFGDMAKEGGAP